MKKEIQFYFIKDEFLDKFSEQNLMRNKPTDGDGKPHGRPCFFAYRDDKEPSILWLVPISSRIEKYRNLEKRRIEKYGRCNDIIFGEVLGREAAFLLQNMCPVTEKYIEPYVMANNEPVNISGNIAEDIRKKVKKIVKKSRVGVRVTYADVMTMYRCLLEEQTRDI